MISIFNSKTAFRSLLAYAPHVFGIFVLFSSVPALADNVGVAPTGEPDVREKAQAELSQIGHSSPDLADIDTGFSSAADFGVECTDPPDEKCMREIGRLLALDAFIAVTPDASKGFLFSYIPMDPAQSVRAVNRDTTEAADVASAIFAIAASDQSVSFLDIKATEGEVYVDDIHVGTSPLSRPLRVPAGEHTVRVQLPDGNTSEKTITTNIGETAGVDATEMSTETTSSGGDNDTTGPTPPPKDNVEEGGTSFLTFAGASVLGLGVIVALAASGTALWAESQNWDTDCLSDDPGAVLSNGCRASTATDLTQTIAIAGWLTAIGGVVIAGVGGTLMVVGMSGGEE